MVEGVEYLHAEQISHRDIKTDNVLLTSKGVVKLIDFGFAVTGPRGDVSCGTPNYMAPELFLRNTSYSPIKVDIWALGVLIYYLFEGSYPFRGYSERELIKNIHKGTYSFQKSPPEIQKVINLGLRMNPDARGTCTDMLAILRE